MLKQQPTIDYFRDLAKLAQQNVTERQQVLQREQRDEQERRLAKFIDVFARSFGDNAMTMLRLVPMTSEVGYIAGHVTRDVAFYVARGQYNWYVWSPTTALQQEIKSPSITPRIVTPEVQQARFDELVLAIAEVLKITEDR